MPQARGYAPELQTMGFPIGGINEGTAYELQPENTTVDAQNVRPFPAGSTDTASGLNSKASGRARGGQRPGMTKYLSTAHTTDATRLIQDINHLAWSDVTPLSGKGHSIMNESTDGSYLLVDSEGTQQGSDGGVSTEVFNVSCWGRDGFGYIATVDSSHKLIIRKINKNAEVKLDWTNADMPSVQLSSATRQVRGMVVVGNTLYVWVKNINGVNGEAVYRVSTSTGKLRETTSGDGTQADHWIVSEHQTTGKFLHFYPSSGNTSQTVNLMTTSDGLLGMVVLNNSGNAGSSDTVTSTIAYNAAATGTNSVQVRLEALTHLSSSLIACTGGPLGTAPVIVEFQGDLGLQDAATLLADTSSLTGGTDGLVVAISQQGDARTNKKLSITSDATGGTFTLSHNARLSVQLIDVETGEQVSCTEVQPYGPDGTPADTNIEADIAADGLGNFYAITAYSTGSFTFALTKVNKYGVQQWQKTHSGVARSVCYNPVKDRVGVCGGNVFGSSRTFSEFATDDGAVYASSSQDAFGDSPESVSIWNVIDVDDKGGYRLFRTETTYNIARMTEATNPAEDWIGSFGAGTAAHTGASCAAAYSLNPENSTSKRQTVRIAVSGGIVKEFDDLVWTSITDGGTLNTPALERNAPVIFSAQLGTNLFYADGRSAQYYKGSTRAMTTWTPTAGTLPIDSSSKRPTLIENWRGRIVMSGTEQDPAEWYMSKVADPFDWQYAPDALTETQAVAGVNSPAGKAPDIVKCIIPVSDDILIFGCDHSIWQLTGDPMLGGRMDRVSDGMGTPWGRPWCNDSSGQFYVFGTRGGVYRGSPGQGVTKITEGRMEERMNDINLDTNLIRLVWNERERGVHVIVTPLTTGDSSTEHYFYDVRSDSWWIDKFANSSHDARATHIFDGDDSNDRAILLGGVDGYIRKWDVGASDDDGTAISSHVYMGPILPKGNGTIKVSEIRPLLARNSSNVTLSVYCGDNAEDAYNQTTAFYTATFSAGKNVAERRAVQAHAVYLKLGNTAVSEKWAMELMQSVSRETSGRFGRIYFG